MLIVIPKEWLLSSACLVFLHDCVPRVDFGFLYQGQILGVCTKGGPWVSDIFVDLHS